MMGSAVSDIQSIRHDLARMDAEFEAVLPKGVRVEEFRRVTLNAIQERPELIDADRQTFFRACLDCARDGLVPDGKEAFFDIRNTKIKVRGQGEVWIQRVVYMPMVRGFYKRAVGPNKALKDWRADVVCENDFYHLEKGDRESFTHKPVVFGDRGKIIGAYSIAEYHDGTISREFMGYADLMKAKAKSTSGNGANSPWSIWEDRMCIKTVVKRHGNRLPIGQEAEDLIDRDNEVQTIEAAPAPARAAVAGSKATAKLAAIAKPEPTQEPQEYVPETEQEAGEAANEERRELTQAPAQRAQEAAQQPGKRGPGRPTNAERQAAASATKDVLAEETQKRAQPAAEKQAAPASAKSQQRSDTSLQGDGQQDTGTPRNGGATNASPSEEDPKHVAYRQGWAAFHAELDRKPPRPLTAANRYDELDQWYEGYDAAAEDAEKGEQDESDRYVDQVYS